MADQKQQRPKADHYNTGEIVIRLQRDKKRSGIYFFGALVAGSAILGFFFFQNHRLGSSSSPPPTAPVAKVDGPHAPRTSVFTPMPPPPPPPPAPATVQVQVQALRPGLFWLDAKPLGVKKDFALTLAPGSYALKGKFGKKVIVEQLAVDPNAPLSVRFDPRKKKAIVRASD